MSENSHEDAGPAEAPVPCDETSKVDEVDYFSQLVSVKETILEGIITAW